MYCYSEVGKSFVYHGHLEVTQHFGCWTLHVFTIRTGVVHYSTIISSSASRWGVVLTWINALFIWLIMLKELLRIQLLWYVILIV